MRTRPRVPRREESLPMSVTVPITITDEAKDYVAELGMQEPFQRMLDHALVSIPGLRELRVSVQPAYDVGMPCILFEALKAFPGLDDPTEGNWGRWRTSEFPPEVYQHFVLLVVYGTADAR
jgi:hypothetical protein